MEDVAKNASKILVMNKAGLYCYDTPVNVFSKSQELMEMGLSVPQITRVFKRLEACGISIDECHTLDEIEKMPEDDRQKLLLPTERLFAELELTKLPAFFEKLFRDGCPIYQKKIKTDFKIGHRVRICSENGHFFALGEVVEREEGSAIRSVKIFEL